jgi:hypothetical protein
MMYHIEKHTYCWTIHNDDNGCSRVLTWQEMMIVVMELPELECEQVTTVYVDEIVSIEEKP